MNLIETGGGNNRRPPPVQHQPPPHHDSMMMAVVKMSGQMIMGTIKPLMDLAKVFNPFRFI
jgi:hypothetical protein